MILSIDDYTVVLPKEGFEITIDRNHYCGSSVAHRSALVICAPFIAEKSTHRPIGHIPNFEKIPAAIAISLYLGVSFLVIDKNFDEVYSDLVQTSLKLNGNKQ